MNDYQIRKHTVPLSAVQSYANKLAARMAAELEKGGVVWKPTADESLVPSSHIAVREQLAEGLLFVSDNNHGNTVLGRWGNQVFRAWHDWQHAFYNLPFTPAAELTLAGHHIRDLGLVPGTLDHDVLLCESAGQTIYFLVHGTFPEDQRAFTMDSLKLGKFAV